jgi:hypothetical protein
MKEDCNAGMASSLSPQRDMANCREWVAPEGILERVIEDRPPTVRRMFWSPTARVWQPTPSRGTALLALLCTNTAKCNGLCSLALMDAMRNCNPTQSRYRHCSDFLITALQNGHCSA